MSDKIFYDAGTIKVTDKKFIVGKKTYVLSNVTSIDIHTQSSLVAKLIGIALIMIGIFLITNESGWGIFLTILGILLSLVKTSYSVLLRTAGNESSAYSSTDKSEIEKIIDSLNDSVSYHSKSEDNNENNSTINSSIADELKKLQELKNDGILTEEEFQNQKEKILNK